MERRSTVLSHRTAGDEDEFQVVADHAPLMMWRSDGTGACDFFNAQWLAFTGRTLEEESGFGWTDDIHPDDREGRLAAYVAAFDAGGEFTMDYRLRRHDGHYRWIRDSARPYMGTDGRFAGYVGFCTDVTDLKQAQADAETALAEQRRLLSELQHRARNNLQLITSMLSLHAASLSDGSAHTALVKASGRVRSVALAQENVQEQDGSDLVRLAEYLRSLARNAEAVRTRKDVKLEIAIGGDLPDIALRRAVPLGLIVNELLSNAFTHAFAADRGGSVRLAAAATSGGTLEVAVSDDGGGFPADYDLERPRTLGLQFVTRLARQAHAELSLDSSPGTRFTLVLAAET